MRTSIAKKQKPGSVHVVLDPGSRLAQLSRVLAFLVSAFLSHSGKETHKHVCVCVWCDACIKTAAKFQFIIWGYGRILVSCIATDRQE